MAATKKAKPKRRKAPARRPVVRRKAAAVRKKPAKKAPIRRVPRKTSKPAARPAAVKPAQVRPPAARPAPASPPAAAEPGERIGIVTHYFGHLSVAIVRLDSGMLRVGDTIHIRGHTSDFTQRVESMEVDHVPVTEVWTNQEFGTKVIEHARESDVVYKVHRP